MAATHRELEEMVQTGDFRDDLFYRLNVVPIWMPALRERPDDIPALAHRFCDMLARDNRRGSLLLTEEAVRQLSTHDWPGNVRELQNFVERLVVFSDGEVIDEADVARELDRIERHRPRRHHHAAPQPGGEPASLADRRAEAEREAVLEALKRCGGNRTKAARLLGISRRTLYNRLSTIAEL